MKNILKPNLVQRESRLKVYNILAIISLLYFYKIWKLKQRNVRRLKAAEMKFTRRRAGFPFIAE